MFIITLFILFITIPFYTNISKIYIHRFVIAMFIITIIIEYNSIHYIYIFLYNNYFYNSYYIIVYKIVICVISIIVLISIPFNSINYINYEFYILYIITIFSIYGIISINDILGIYIFIELQSFCIYIFCIIYSKTKYSILSGIQYFFIGTFASIIILIGISYIYSNTGITSFIWIYSFNIINIYNSNIIIGYIFIIIGLLIKIGTAPFHIWTVQVYNNTPIIITNIIMNIPKVSILYVIYNLIYNLNISYIYINNMFYIFIILSFIVGSIYPIGIVNIKRILTYSTINQLGFIFIPIIVCNYNSIFIFWFYYIQYIIINIVFISIIYNSINRYDIKYIYTLTGFIYINKYISIISSILLLSFAGIPPLLGFIGKYYCIILSIYNSYYIITYISIITSIIASYYYINIIRYILFYYDSNYVTYYYTYFNTAYSNIYSALLSTITIFTVIGFVYTDYIMYYVNIIYYVYMYLFIYIYNYSMIMLILYIYYGYMYLFIENCMIMVILYIVFICIYLYRIIVWLNYVNIIYCIFILYIYLYRIIVCIMLILYIIFLYSYI